MPRISYICDTKLYKLGIPFPIGTFQIKCWLFKERPWASWNWLMRRWRFIILFYFCMHSKFFSVAKCLFSKCYCYYSKGSFSISVSCPIYSSLYEQPRHIGRMTGGKAEDVWDAEGKKVKERRYCTRSLCWTFYIMQIILSYNMLL